MHIVFERNAAQNSAQRLCSLHDELPVSDTSTVKMNIHQLSALTGEYFLFSSSVTGSWRSLGCGPNTRRHLHTLYRAEQLDTCQMINMKITIISCRLSEECEVSGVNLWQRDQTMFRICAAKWVNAKPDGSVRARQHSTTTTSKLHWRKIQNNKQPLLSRLHYTAGRAAAKHDVSRSPKWLFRSMICSQQQFRRQNKFSSPSFKTDTIRNHHLRGWNSDLLHQLLTWCLSVH